LLALIYHPPKPIYNINDFLVRLNDDIDELSAQYPGSIIYLTGDFNKLTINNLIADNGLCQMVSGATRAANTLDLFLTNRPDTVTVQVVQSSVKTDHKALLVNSRISSASLSSSSSTQSRRSAIVYDTRAQHIFNLVMALEDYNWSHVLADNDIDSVYQAFLGANSRTILRLF